MYLRVINKSYGRNHSLWKWWPIFDWTMYSVMHSAVLRGFIVICLVSHREFLTAEFLIVSLSGVDSVGTVSASLITYASIQALQPDLVINAGTAGGFKVLLMLLWWLSYNFVLMYWSSGLIIIGILPILFACDIRSFILLLTVLCSFYIYRFFPASVLSYFINHFSLYIFFFIFFTCSFYLDHYKWLHWVRLLVIPTCSTLYLPAVFCCLTDSVFIRRPKC